MPRVTSIDETSWYCRNTLQWLWVMVSERVAFSMIHPRRSKEVFAALIDAWEGLLVSDGYGVYPSWVKARQTCLAHLIRTARSLAERQPPELAACGAWALAELQRLCHMATAPPTGGEWQAWYARLCRLIDQYHDRQDDAGKLARRLLREMDSLWVFLGFCRKARFLGKIQKFGVRNSMTYRLPNSRKSNFATEPSRVPIVAEYAARQRAQHVACAG